MINQTKIALSSNIVSFIVGFLGIYFVLAFGYTLCLPFIVLFSWLNGNFESFFEFGKIYIITLLLAFVNYLFIKRFENKIDEETIKKGFEVSVVIHTLALILLIYGNY